MSAPAHRSESAPVGAFGVPPVASGSPDVASSDRRRLTALAVVGGILLVCALGLNAAVAKLNVTFQKRAVDLRHPVTAIPAQLGPWVQVTVDEPLSAEIEHELGTKEYIQRLYVDTRKADEETLAAWNEALERGARAEERERLRIRLRESVVSRDPHAAVTLHVAYYTGGVDTVPHIPDRCMVAGGFDAVGRREVDLPVASAPGESLTVSFTQFQQRAGHARPTTLNVSYFFKVNGDWEHDAVTGVRRRLQNLLETHAYFAKIEVMTVAPTLNDAEDARRSQVSMADFLEHALPGIEGVLPDWDQVMAEAAAGRGEGR